MANFAQLGIQIDSKQAEDAARDLDKLTAAGERAEKATDKLSKSTTDWAAEQQKANARAREMEQADARRAASAQKANESIKDQQRELAKLIGQIDPAVSALARLDEQERKLAQFRKQGAIDSDTFAQYNKRLQDQRNILGGVSDAQGKAGMSARAYSAAMRNVPAQITDITTSLISGQPAYLVAIQQGGQLKDMFGGIGPAARALTTSLIGMINPLSLVAAGVAALAFAWKQGAENEYEFNKALILTGNYAGVTADQLTRMVSQLDNISGVTAGSARDALLAVASSGKITGEQFEMVARSAAQMQSIVGVSVDETVSKFLEIQRAPVEALMKLNDAEHFLTQAQLDRIKALADEGRQQEAVAEATRIYADNLDNVANRAEQALPAISRWWNAVKDETSGAWNELKTYIGLVSDAIELKARFFTGNDSPGWLSNFAASFLPSNRLKMLNSFARQKNAADRGADFSGVSSRVLEDPAQSSEQAAAAAAWKQRVESLDVAKRREAEILKIRREGNLAGISEVEIERQVTAYKKQQADADAKKSTRRGGSNADINSTQALIDSADRQIEANRQVAESGEAVSASRRKIIEIDQRLAETGNLMTAAQRAQLIVAKESLATTDAQAEARRQLARDTAAGLAMEERLAQLYKQQADQNEIALMGIGRGSQVAEIAQRELNIRREYLAEVEKLEKAQRNKNTELSAAEYQRQKDLLAASLADRIALEKSYQDQRVAMQGDWRNGMTSALEDYAAQAANIAALTENMFTNAFSSMEDALVNFVVTGKLNFQDFANSIIKDLARIAAQKMIAGIAGNILGGAVGGPTMEKIGLVGGSGAGGTWSSGGYTGPGGVHQPAGIVHKGEVVWSQADVKAVGGPAAANSMRPTAGYARGGAVGVSVGPMAQTAINIQVENKGEPVSATASASRQPDGSMLIKMVLDAVADNVASGGSVTKAIKGRLNVSERV